MFEIKIKFSTSYYYYVWFTYLIYLATTSLLSQAHLFFYETPNRAVDKISCNPNVYIYMQFLLDSSYSSFIKSPTKVSSTFYSLNLRWPAPHVERCYHKLHLWRWPASGLLPGFCWQGYDGEREVGQPLCSFWLELVW